MSEFRIKWITIEPNKEKLLQVAANKFIYSFHNEWLKLKISSIR